MPVTRIDELISRELDDSSITREYHFHGPATESEVVTAIATLPLTVGLISGGPALPRASHNVTEVSEIAGDWRVRVVWGVPDKREPQPIATAEYRFSFQAPSAHIKQSLQTILYSTTSGSNSNPSVVLAPNHRGAINVVHDDGKMRVEGVDLAPPPEVFTITYAAQSGTITPAYQDLVASMVGKVNSVTYKSRWPAGTLFLSRVSGGLTSQNSWNIDFGFSYIPNQTFITVGNFTVSAKDGHDLLWVYYGPEADAVAKTLVKPPTAAYVERVWLRTDFTALGLP